MPNHISNRLVVTANSNEEITLFLDAIESEEMEHDKCLVIDFNKIIPMPEELRNTSASSDTDNGIYYYLVQSNQRDMLKHLLYCPEFYSMDRFKTYSQNKLNELYAIGEKYVALYRKYGSKDWYDWSLANWGSKWNAYETYLEYIDECTVIIYFQTAWSGVPAIVEELTALYPALTFEYVYADEDMGYNCGKGWGEDGDFSFRLLDGGSDEAMETYILCWNEDEDNFYKDDDGVWHNRMWDDDYDDEDSL